MPSPYANRDAAVVFFKKYNHKVKPDPYYIPVVPFQKEVIPAIWEDSIEVVTLLHKAAQVRVNDHLANAGVGISSLKFPMQAGPVHVTVLRNNVTVVKFTTPEGITNTPYRSDRITYSFSSEFDDFYKDLFTGFKPEFSTEYNPAFKGQ